MVVQPYSVKQKLQLAGVVYGSGWQTVRACAPPAALWRLGADGAECIDRADGRSWATAWPGRRGPGRRSARRRRHGRVAFLLSLGWDDLGCARSVGRACPRVGSRPIGRGPGCRHHETLGPRDVPRLDPHGHARGHLPRRCTSTRRSIRTAAGLRSRVGRPASERQRQARMRRRDQVSRACRGWRAAGWKERGPASCSPAASTAARSWPRCSRPASTSASARSASASTRATTRSTRSQGTRHCARRCRSR